MQVVSAPVIGKVAQVGIERVVGTIIGGWTGYAVYMLGSTVWNTTTDGMLHSHQLQVSAQAKSSAFIKCVASQVLFCLLGLQWSPTSAAKLLSA